LRRLTDPNAKPYAVFEKDDPNNPIFDFSKIKHKIEELTEKVCGSSKGIVDDPIILNVYSPSCPDLTLIDLPGITRIAQGGQASNIEEVTKNMAARYCGDERTIILCVIPANQDMSTSDGLQMAMKLDPKGERTIGVITKIDIMDRGTNAKKMLLNEEIPLKMGYVGVKGRSQLDIRENMKVNEALQDERNYFAKHPIYSNMPPGFLGTEALTAKLTTVMYKHIKKIMPSIIMEIDSKTYECEKNLKELGTPLPGDDREKLLLVWRLISDFTEKVKTSISGDYNPEIANIKKDLLGGVRVRLKFNDLFIDEMSLKYKASKKYSDPDIRTALRLHMGNSLPGFTSADAFLSLMNPLLQKLKEPALNLLEEVHGIMEQICVHYINETFLRFPMFINEVTDSTLNIMSADKERAKLLLTEIIDANIGYTYTKDPEYIAVILPQSEKDKLEKQKEKERKAAEDKAREEEKLKQEAANAPKDAKGNPVNTPKAAGAGKDKEEENAEEEDISNIRVNKDKAQKQMEKILIKEMRIRIDTYFRVVVTQLADMIPKLIGHNLVNASIRNLQFSVFKRVSAGSIFDLLKEPEHIVKKRETLKRILEILRNSRKILLRDPDLAYSLELKDSSALLEMREKDKERKKTAAEEKKRTFMQKASEAMSDLGAKIKQTTNEVKSKLTSEDSKTSNATASTSKTTVVEPAKATVTTTPSAATNKTQTGKSGEVDLLTDAAKLAYQQKTAPKSEADLAVDAAKLAYQHKDTIIKVAKENPELLEKGANIIKEAAAPPKTTATPAPKKDKINSLFGF